MDYLSNYKPSLPDLLKDFTITEELPEQERAFELYKMLKVAKRYNESMFLIIGKLLKEIRDEKLYEKLDYPSFSQFLSSEDVGYSRESAYLFIRAYEYLIEHLQLNADAVGKMNIGRINMMIPVLKKIEESEGKEAAIKQMEDMDSLRHGDFVKTIHESKLNAKPEVYFTQEDQKWHVNYFEDTTVLYNKGNLMVEGELV